MERAKGTWKNGQVVLDEPADWPEGCRVLVEPAHQEESLGIPEEEWPSTPEALAEWLQWFDSFKPVELSAADEAEWKAAQKAVKDHTLANLQ